MASSDAAPAGIARASVSSLPLELIHHIIKLSVPPLTERTFQERYQTLRRLALVNVAWSRLAQTELNRHISLSRAGYNTLANALRGPKDGAEASQRAGQSPRGCWKLAMRQRASTLRLQAREDPWTVDEAQAMLQLLPNAYELRVGHIMSDPYVSDYLGSSAFASSLRILHLTTTLLTPSAFSPVADVFPNLTELVLESPCSVIQAMDFLQYTSFPSLRSLALLSWNDLDRLRDGARLDSALRHLAHNLHRFATDCAHFIQGPNGEIPYQLDLTDYTSLRHLTVPLARANINVRTLDRLPSQLHSLRLLDNFFGDDVEILSLLGSEWPKCMGTLKKITLPESAGTSTPRSKYSEYCISKGVAVEYRDTTDFD